MTAQISGEDLGSPSHNAAMVFHLLETLYMSQEIRDWRQNWKLSVTEHNFFLPYLLLYPNMIPELLLLRGH